MNLTFTTNYHENDAYTQNPGLHTNIEYNTNCLSPYSLSVLIIQALHNAHYIPDQPLSIFQTIFQNIDVRDFNKITLQIMDKTDNIEEFSDYIPAIADIFEKVDIINADFIHILEDFCFDYL